MNFKKVATLVLSAVAVVGLAACSNQSSQSTSTPSSSTNNANATTTVKLASIGSDADVWRYIAGLDATKEAGLTIEVQEINGGVPLNQAVFDGVVDANAFQSIGYMDSFNSDQNGDLVPIGTTYIEPMGLYSKKHTSLSDLPDGATVALADNPANTTRALRLLEKAGLITLPANFNDGTGTPSDIATNPKNLQFLLIDDTTGVRVLDDVDLVAIGNTIALEGGLNVLKDSLFREEADESTKASINVITVKDANKDNEALKKLVDLYHLPEVQKYVTEQFDGTKVEVNKPVSEVWEKK